MKGSFTRKEVAAIAGITDRTVWFYTQKGLVVPEVDNPVGRGTTRRYSAKNIVEILVVREMAKMGLSLEIIFDILAGPRLLGSDGFNPWDPECPEISDSRYYMIVYDGTTNHAKLVVMARKADQPLDLDMDGKKYRLPEGVKRYTSALTIDITGLREQVLKG